jgi:hypothetical protein
MITLTSVKSPVFLFVRLFIYFLFHFLLSNIDWSCVAFVDLTWTVFLVELADARESRNDFVACFNQSTCNRGAFVCFRWCSKDDVFHIHLFMSPHCWCFSKKWILFSLSLSGYILLCLFVCIVFMIIISSTESRLPPVKSKVKNRGLPHFHVMIVLSDLTGHCSMYFMYYVYYRRVLYRVKTAGLAHRKSKS